MRYDELRLGALCRGQAGRSRSVWVRPVVVRFGEAGLGQTGYGGHGPIRSVKFWCTSVRHGHGEAVLIRCVRVRFDRVRTRCGSHVKVRYVVFR